jgi:hypothetical protein
MADKIVGFSIQIKGQNDVKSTTQLLGLLNTQLILVANTLGVIEKTSGKALGELTSDIKTVSGSVATMGGVVKSSFASFERGNGIVQDLGNGFLEVTKEIDRTAKSVKGLTQEELVQLEVQRAIAREQKQVAKQQAIIQKEGKDNIASLRAQLSLTTLEWSKFTQAELKNTEAGRKAAAEKLRLTNLLVKEEKATGDARRQVGFYEKATASLGKTLLKLSVGRDVVRGLFQSFVTLVGQTKDTNEAAKSITASFDKLRNVATKFGTAVINFVAAPLKLLIDGAEGVAKSLFGIDFSAAKASDGVRDLQVAFNSEIETLKAGNLSTEARKQLITDINTKYKEYLPNLLSENASLEEITNAQNAANKAFEKKITLLASEEQFVDITKRRLDALRDSAKLQTELTAREKEYNEAVKNTNNNNRNGIDLGIEAARQRIAAVNGRIQGNKEIINGIEQEKKALDEVIKAEGINTADFVSNQKVKTEAQTKAIDEAAEAEKRRLEQLKSDQDQALEDLKANNLARLLLVKELSNELIQVEIDNIQDQTIKAIAAEQERFRLEKEARKANLEQTAKDIETEGENLKKLFGVNSEEYKKFVAESGEQLIQVKDITRKQDEQSEAQHQNNLNKIIKDGADANLEAEKKAGEARAKIATESFNVIQNAYKKNIANLTEFIKKNAEEAAKTTQAVKDTIVSVIGSAFQAISDIAEIANNAENERLDAAIQNRQDSIDSLNEELQTATGLQKQFLNQQLKQEQEALNAETKAKEKAQKEQAETQKGIAIAQALINGALGVTGIWAGVISGNPVIDAVLKAVLTAALVVTTATQVAAISSQKFAKGGVLEGNSHANGGIPATVGGRNVELEGGEAVINKRSTSMFMRELSAINEAGGGVRFANGGVLGEPMPAPNVSSQIDNANMQVNAFLSASMAMVQATNNRIDKLQVIQDLNNLQDIQKNDAKLQVRTTLR